MSQTRRTAPRQPAEDRPDNTDTDGNHSADTPRIPAWNAFTENLGARR